MTSNYKYTRNWENQQKAIFDGVGEYDIPVIQPEEYHHVNWIGAYLQSKGVHVIPTISWSTPDSFDWCFDGEPRESVVAVSSVGCNRVLDKFVEGYNAMIQALNPSTIIFYGKIPDECKGNIVHVKSYGALMKEAITNGW